MVNLNNSQNSKYQQNTNKMQKCAIYMNISSAFIIMHSIRFSVKRKKLSDESVEEICVSEIVGFGEADQKT